MEISNKKLDQFINLYRSEYGEEIGREEALERGLALIQLVRLANENENYGTN